MILVVILLDFAPIRVHAFFAHAGYVGEHLSDLVITSFGFFVRHFRNLAVHLELFFLLLLLDFNGELSLVLLVQRLGTVDFLHGVRGRSHSSVLLSGLERVENHRAGSPTTLVAAEFELALSIGAILSFDFFNDLLLLFLFITADILIDFFLIEVHKAT